MGEASTKLEKAWGMFTEIDKGITFPENQHGVVLQFYSRDTSECPLGSQHRS